MHLFKKILKWTVIVLVGLFVVAELIRWPFRVRNEKTAEQVVKIHSTKLTLDDVMGVNLPPDPGLGADKTIPGIDANQNGIRDDVELTIFREYPNSAKTRAVLLQYALALQMQVIQQIVNQDIVIATIQEEDRAYSCVGEILNRDDENEEVMSKYFEDSNKLSSFIEERQLNTLERKSYRTNFYEKIGSYSSLERVCDIDYSTLPN